MINLLIILLLIILIIYGIYLLIKTRKEQFVITNPTISGIKKNLYLNPPSGADKLGIKTNPIIIQYECVGDDCKIKDINENFEDLSQISPSPSNSTLTANEKLLNTDNEIDKSIIKIDGLVNNINSNVIYVKQKLEEYKNNYENFVNLINSNLEFQNDEVNKLKNKINYTERFEDKSNPNPILNIKINKRKIYDKINLIST